MGQEYQLKKLYESLLKGEKVEQKQNKTPKTLAEAYQQKLISERTVFFAKDDNKYTTLGVVEDPEEASEIKNNIKSYSIIATTSKMLQDAGWEPNNAILSTRKLGSLILQKEIDILDLTKISNSKEKLTNLQNYIVGSDAGKKFNVIEAIVAGIQEVIGETLRTPIENLSSLAKSLITQVGRIEGTDVGPGEMSITLLTNAKKPSTKGDLDFAGNIVEAKASSYGKENKLSGAALGYAKHASGGALKSAIDNLLKTKSTTPNRELFKYKKAYDDTVESLETNSSLLPLTPKFFEQLKVLSKELVQDSESFKEKFNSLFGMNFDAMRVDSRPKVLEGIKTLINNGFLDKNKITQEILQNSKNNVFMAIQQMLYSGAGLFGKAKNVYKKVTSLAAAKAGKEQQPSSLTVAFQDFFLSDLGFSSQQLAGVLLEARPNSEHDEGLLKNLQEVLDNGYLQRLQRHDISALRGLVFAIHLSEYAKAEGFQSLMVFNYTTGEALAIPTNTSFTDLLKFYQDHTQQIAFVIDFGGRQGAHKLALR